MRVLIASLYGRWGTHLGTDLEIAERHLAAGDEVSFLVCDRDLARCDANTEHSYKGCFSCRGRRRDGVAKLSKPVSLLRLRDYFGVDDRRRVAALIPKDFEDRDALRELTLESFDIGLATLSSLITMSRDSDLEVSDHAEATGDFLQGAAFAYLATRNCLRQETPDRVYVFNGRMAPLRAVLRACEGEGVSCFVHERGRDLHHYSLFENTLPHDIAYNEARIRRRWAEPDPPREEKVALADAWFAARAKGVIAFWHSYTASQEAGSLPPGWDPTRHNVALFSSSEDECAAIGREWSGPLFGDQAEAIRDLVAAWQRARPSFHLYLRLHPSQVGVDNRSMRIMRGLEEVPFVTVVPPESPLSSYALLHACDKVVSFGSTVGIEAVYWGKASVLLGSCFYRNLGGTHIPQHFDEAVALIGADLPARDREAALMYGYDQATLGTPFRHFCPDGIYEGTFNGEAMEATGFYAAAKWGATRGRKAAKIARKLARSVGAPSRQPPSSTDP